MNLLGTGSSGSKIILTGEHAVVHGIPAIAIPFNGVKTTVNIYKTNNDVTVDSKFHNGPLRDGVESINGLKRLIVKLFKDENIKLDGYHFEIISNIESQRGMGSSAAVSVALVKAFYDAFNIELTDHKLIENAMYAEQIHHTNPSGLDVYTLVYQKPVWFIRNKGFETIDINLEANLVIIDTNLMSQTRTSVEAVERLKKEQPEFVEKIFNQIKNVSIKARTALENNDLETLEKVIELNQQLLTQINVSSDIIDSTIKRAKSLGIKSMKLTGGGIGGCVIGFSNDLEVILKLKKSFRNVWIDNLGGLNESKS